ncbi:MAG: hypothetical protein ACRBDL_11295 [Alphaproteobacteria bacterium]
MIEDAYQIPALFYILCVMSSMAFVVCSTEWFVRALRSDSGTEISFSLHIWRGQGKSFLFVLIISLLVGLYDYVFADRPIFIAGEVSILLCTYLYLLMRRKVDGAVQIWSFTKSYVSLGFLCLFGWGATVVFGFVLMQVLQTISAVNNTDFFIVVIFLTGLLWNAPVLMLYQKVLKDSVLRPVLKGQGFHKFLWPVLLAYTVLLIPLMLQQKVNSEEWKEMLRAKPMRQTFVSDIANPLV